MSIRENPRRIDLYLTLKPRPVLTRSASLSCSMPRGAEWQAYPNGLLELHARKYKLVPMLRGIR